MAKPRPDPEQLAEARRRAAFWAEHAPGLSNTDGERILALETLGEFIIETFEGSREQIAWALLWAENPPQGTRAFEEHERKLIEEAWEKVNEDADRAEWERLGLQGGNA